VRGWWDGGLEYLKLPQWRAAFETADVILGVDVLTHREFLVFGRGALRLVAVAAMTDWSRVLRITIDSDSDELELLVAVCEVFRGHQDYEPGWSGDLV
jgi:hypothetical protein